MEYEVIGNFVHYQRARAAVDAVCNKELSRRSLLQNAILLKTVLTQQLHIESSNHKESKDHSSVKQDLTKAQHEKKLLENKISMLTTEIETWKKKSANQSSLQKETLSLKNQITKLNSQLNESRNEIGKVKQQFVTQKAVLESKLENAKKNIKNLKDKNTLSPSKALQPPSSILSPVKSQTKSLNNHQKLGLKRPLVSNFSTSPFLNKNLNKPTTTSPTKKDGNQDNFKSPAPLNAQNLLATSTPGAANAISPLKDLKAKRPSGLKNLISPAKPDNRKATSKKKPSLFDDDDEDDDDIFGNSIRKLDGTKNTPRQEPPATEELKESHDSTDETKKKQPVKRKRKIGGKAIIEDDNDEEPKFSPLKKVKLLDKLGGISPLKQRNQERNLFKV